ncbi:Multidrug and toxin extrusion protein 1 [Phytophthora ramorum]|uniref:Multidrug and toxin extrusion protein 1 n=1 Tax=Phytophthora ramorum TaxID=164328 RepID=UPI0030AC806A|nr:Multidrug and toxin extrusion protein 1 [Phytophthora ramorum]
MLMLSMEMWAFEALTDHPRWLLPDSVVTVAAHSVLVNVDLLVYTTFTGLSVATNIRVGNCLGANLPKTAKLARTVAISITFVTTLVFMALIFGLSGWIPLLFLDKGESADLASKVMAIMSPQKIPDGLNAVIQGIFRGAGKQKSAAIINALAYYLFGVPFGALLAFQCGLGVQGLWIGMASGNVLAVSAMAVRMLCTWNWDRLADDAKARTDL